MFSIRNKFISYLLMTCSFAITVFIFSNAFELIFNHDLPIISAIKKVDLSLVSQNNKLTDCEQSVYLNWEKYGDPIRLKITDQARAQLVPAIKKESFLARAYALHFLCFREDDSSQENLLIYGNSSIRTIDQDTNINIGDLVLIETGKKWRFVFRVDDIKKKTNGSNFIVEKKEKPATIIYLSDDSGQAKTIIKAKYLATEKFE